MHKNLWAAAFCAVAALPAAADELPLRLQDPAPASAGSSFFDFSRLELGIWLGIAGASSDYESDPSPAGGGLLRVPLPWLSSDLLGMKDDAFGVFVQGSVTSVERELDPAPPDAAGPVVIGGLGLDFALVRDESHLLMAQLGVQYVHLSGVFEADDGAGLLLGVMGGLKIAERSWVTLNPQWTLGDEGEFLWTLGLGVLVGF